jgi:ankyrin repeat protein
VDATRDLYIAVLCGDAGTVDAALAAGADPGWRNFWGDSLTTAARDRGFEAIAARLEGAKASSPRVAPSESGEDHPIHIAAELGDARRVRALLDGDQTLVHLADRAGGTPLHRAALSGSRQTMALLLDRGADVNAMHGSGLGSYEGYAPEQVQPIDMVLWWAPRRVRPPRWRRVTNVAWYWLRRVLGEARIGYFYRDAVRLLVSRGAPYDLPVAAAVGDADRIREILDADPSRVHEARPNGRLALRAAVERGHDHIVRLLLARGADPTWPDWDSSRGAALHAAARQGNEPMVRLLLDHGADPNGFVNASGNAVFVAKTPQIRRLLIERGGTIDPFDLVWLDEDDEVMRQVTRDPQSAEAGCGGVFTAVVTRGKHDLLKRLLDAGFRVPARVDGCHSYLFERPDMLRTLLASGMSPDLPGGDTAMMPLHHLCSRDTRNRTMRHRTEIAGILLDAGASISPRDLEYESTPLAWAARCNLPDMVEFLLSRGAPTNLPDDKPWATPLAWATSRGHAEIAATLRAAGAR